MEKPNIRSLIGEWERKPTLDNGRCSTYRITTQHAAMTVTKKEVSTYNRSVTIRMDSGCPKYLVTGATSAANKTPHRRKNRPIRQIAVQRVFIRLLYRLKRELEFRLTTAS
ncbi:hypothetical protein IIA15_08450 [candidate division TA06 bacterium]|nr:hypothetical protein [candidate division TA06 bacterium]